MVSLLDEQFDQRLYLPFLIRNPQEPPGLVSFTAAQYGTVEPMCDHRLGHLFTRVDSAGNHITGLYFNCIVDPESPEGLRCNNCIVSNPQT
ncbi:hypothetical protein FBEOM_7551 [Fusarium beomiforme]|uniref:Uncharacterized protein n=1 Tax=Fusarium beomiforme TaxID=44412 RepID=A0A9P5AIH8_9HYPO|nr:hypothetical protein FBEOM_7551 [Fusarium beomiforme]